MSGAEGESRFRIGGRYENHKGHFEVVAMGERVMRIRWDSGEETECEIALQERFVRNREKEMSHAAHVPSRSGKLTKSSGLGFAGLGASDFTGEVAGTSWRSREQLGGAVTRLLKTPALLTSWGVRRRPEIHWATVDRYDVEKPWTVTKFFLRVDQSGIHFGLYWERSYNLEDRRDEWMKWLQWLEVPASSLGLHRQLLQTNSRLLPYLDGSIGSYSGGFVPTETGYDSIGSPRKRINTQGLSSFLSSLPKDGNISIIGGRKMDCDSAISLGTGLAAELAGLFNALMPAYLLKQI